MTVDNLVWPVVGAMIGCMSGFLLALVLLAHGAISLTTVPPTSTAESATETGAVISVPETRVISVTQGQVSFPFLLVLHDDSNNVTCWALVPVTGVGGLDCMPDAEFAQREPQ
jgi:hypothetical protein